MRRSWSLRAAATSAAAESAAAGLRLRSTQRAVAVNLPALRSDVTRILADLRLSHYALSVWLTTDQRLRDLNRTYRSIDRSTDVLSFPFQKLTPSPADVPPAQRAPPPAPHDVRDLGEIVVSAPYVERQAKEQGVALEQRMRTVVVHGVCHLLGYDHETAADAELMEAEEARLMHVLEKGK